MAYVPGSLTLSRAAWGIARQVSGVESQHPLLHVPFVPLEDDEGRRTANDAMAELTATWAAHGRQISKEFVAVLRLLAAPSREVHGWIGLHNRSEITVVSAADGDFAVSVAADSARIYLDPIDPAKLVDSAIELLPRYPASSARSISVPKDFYQQATGGGQQRSGGGYLVGSQQAAGPARDVGALKMLLADGRKGGGRFYVAVRDRMGRRHKSEKPLTYLDLDSGRVLFWEQLNSVGEPWLVAAPATPASIAADLSARLDQLR
ncbi:MAG TPA: ESX secretion-associated protein EspG [Pseudonocardiaceae bacterium]